MKKTTGPAQARRPTEIVGLPRKSRTSDKRPKVSECCLPAIRTAGIFLKYCARSPAEFECLPQNSNVSRRIRRTRGKSFLRIPRGLPQNSQNARKIFFAHSVRSPAEFAERAENLFCAFRAVSRRIRRTRGKSFLRIPRGLPQNSQNARKIFFAHSARSAGTPSPRVQRILREPSSGSLSVFQPAPSAINRINSTIFSPCVRAAGSKLLFSACSRISPLARAWIRL